MYVSGCSERCFSYGCLYNHVYECTPTGGFFLFRSELNLGVDRSGFTLVRFCKENPELDLLVKVGYISPLSSVI